MLKLAAYIGNHFDLSTLAIVSQQSESDVATALWKALQEELVLPKSELYKFYLEQEQQRANTNTIENVTYRFLHDRVQQAAYSLIPSDQKQQTHRTIGELLFRHTAKAEVEEKIFHIVNLLNYGVELIAQPSQRAELAQLNLLAGKERSKLATGYESAYGYFDQGIHLLTSDCWQSQYPDFSQKDKKKGSKTAKMYI